MWPSRRVDLQEMEWRAFGVHGLSRLNEVTRPDIVTVRVTLRVIAVDACSLVRSRSVSMAFSLLVFAMWC